MKLGFTNGFGSGMRFGAMQGTGVVAPVPITYIEDYFVQSPAGNLNLHTPDVDVSGLGWTAQAGTINAGGTANSITANTLYTINPGVSDCRLRCNVSMRASGLIYLILRFADTSNYLRIAIRQDTGWFYIQKVEGGSSSNLGGVSGLSLSASVFYAIDVTLSGNSVVAHLEGGNEISAETTFNQTETLFGVGASQSTNQHDNFIIDNGL